MQNHFDQAELIIQAESGDFAFVIPTCKLHTTITNITTITTITRTMTNAKHLIMRRPTTIFVVEKATL